MYTSHSRNGEPDKYILSRPIEACLPRQVLEEPSHSDRSPIDYASLYVAKVHMYLSLYVRVCMYV